MRKEPLGAQNRKVLRATLSATLHYSVSRSLPNRHPESRSNWKKREDAIWILSRRTKGRLLSLIVPFPVSQGTGGRFSLAIVCLRLNFDPMLQSGSRRQRHFDSRERRTGDPRPIHFSQAADQLFGARLFTGLLGHLAIYQKRFLQFLHY